MTNKKHFTFLPNGKPVSSLKNEAKKLHKSGEVKGITAAQNHISKALFNKSFNKLSVELEERSPIVMKKALYLPIVCKTDSFSSLNDGEEFCYYIAIDENQAAGAFGFSVNIHEFVDSEFIETLTLKHFEKIDDTITNTNGWKLTLNNDHYLIVKTTCEGIALDIYFDNGTDVESVDSSWLFWDEMVNVSTFDYNAIQTIAKTEDVTDYKASYLLEHDNIDASSLIYTIGDIECKLYSTWLVVDQNGQNLSPKEAVAEAKNEGLEKELWLWLEGREHPHFEDWIAESAPYFGYCTVEGDPCGEVFDTTPKTLSDQCFNAAAFFFS